MDRRKTRRSWKCIITASKNYLIESKVYRDGSMVYDAGMTPAAEHFPQIILIFINGSWWWWRRW